MYFQRWKGMLFVFCVILLAMSFASCTKKEQQAIDKIADELITEGPAGANLTPSATVTPTHTSTPTPTPTITPTPTPVKVSYADDPDDVKCPVTHNALHDMGFVDLIGYELVLDGRHWVGTMQFADMDLGSSIQTQPYWLAGVVGGSPQADPLYGMNQWGWGEWSVDCWQFEGDLKCGFAMRENDTFSETDHVVDVILEGNTLSFVFPYGFPRLGDTFGVYAQTDSAFDYYGIDDTGLLLDVDLQCPYPSELVGIVLDTDYTVCGSGCRLRQNIVEGQKVEVWCMPDDACVALGCDCHLFSSALDDPPQDPDSWEHEAEPANKIQMDNTRAYHCFCVK